MSMLTENQADILSNYILSPKILLNENDLKILPRTVDMNKLLNVSECPASTTLKADRDVFTGQIKDFIEIQINYADQDARNSMSINREPGQITDSVRGSAMNLPFWPAGLAEPTLDLESFDINDFEFEDDILLTVPPGFAHGIEFVDEDMLEENNSEENVNLITALEENIISDEWMQISRGEITIKNINIENFDTKETIIDGVLNKNNDNNVLEISKTRENLSAEYKWAEIVDVSQPVVDFEKKIPEPALTYPFELDNFQKQAILQLENRQFVFVAAHTSAGKTVIAEYAIALSQNHMTKTIYTSPIKALSNQKYRDFKTQFKDVGLITGDLQIEPKASCLIMTTEILRSMLFCGSDVIRDIEYVIFDEVHYINDASRGHVWEEVIVMLPGHVNIIMLSATVPNPLELANWVGTIKERKVYVISTYKRPVPLMHHLYIDSSGKSKNDLHLIVDANGNFQRGIYNTIKTEMKNTSNTSRFGPNAEKGLLITLLNKLKAKDKLPVVVFTLSRNRCDKNVDLLKSLELNTGKEQAIVHQRFEKWSMQLKPKDRELKQVLTLKNSLKRGIGVHHSGILPILKEIVEMLFQDGFVKVLFATETFAMGVNMPARTVIFDSISKFNGVETRNIKSSEYTQMAGRAGRRGHDKNGTVIILCKQKLPTAEELTTMILGAPELLRSQFILRYAVILNCLRIERYQVEGILENSFLEFNLKKLKPEKLKLLEKAEEKLATVEKLGENLQKLSEFYDIAYSYLNIKSKCMKIYLESNMKKIQPGKIVIVTSGYHYNKLGIVLSVKLQGSKETTMKVLVLDHQNSTENLNEINENKNELWHKMLSLIQKHKMFLPNGAGGHSLVEIKISEIVHITKSQIKIDSDIIIKNCEMRQIARFQSLAPTQAVQKAITELKILNDNQEDIVKIEIRKELTQLENNFMMQELKSMEKKLGEVLPYTNIADFELEFSKVFQVKQIEYEISNLKFLNSKENLSLYPDYCAKLNVLRNLKYIDENEEVTFKGKIACNMGQNELFITELILGNLFNDLNSAEIAALLSSLVFQAKTQVEVTPPNEKIKMLMNKFQEIKESLDEAESQCQSVNSIVQLNFGLVEVVYEWARDKPFAEITNLTDIQEGIIVRCIQQLDETIQDIKKAAKVIGNPTLQNKMTDASTAIKRDIVFTPSLYTV